MRRSVSISLIHIAENSILNNYTEDYIKVLKEMNKPYIKGKTVESDISTSLYLSFKSNNKPRFIIKGYDKGAEYCKRHDSPICKLYEPLTDREIELLGDSYDPYTHSLDMSKVNMLRLEVELVRKDKLIPIIKRISENADALTLPMILYALDNNMFYAILREVLNEKLLKYVFTTKDSFEKVASENKLSTININACMLQLNDSNAKYFTALMGELGYEDKINTMNRIVRKIVPDSELYTELYSAVFSNDSRIISDEPTEELSLETPNSAAVDSIVTSPTKSKEHIASLDLYNSGLKDFILVHEVPFWDDS